MLACYGSNMFSMCRRQFLIMEFSEESKRNLLRLYMRDCPCCHPDEVYDIKSTELDDWLTSHDEVWYRLIAIDNLVEDLADKEETIKRLVIERNEARDALQRIFGHECN